MIKLGAFVAKEVREVLPATILFLFLFHMIALTKAVALGDYSSSALRATTATVGALIVAKAILVVEALPISRLFSSPRASHILWKTLLFGVVALLFRFVEEIIELASKHGGLAAATQVMFREIAWPLFWVLMLWVLGGLLLYSLASELVRTVGPEKVKAAFFGTSSG
jgi:ABC-type polysaccharide transport system permease subunit